MSRQASWCCKPTVNGPAVVEKRIDSWVFSATGGRKGYGAGVLSTFLTNNRIELIARCRAKVALRTAPNKAPGDELDHGVTPFIDQLIKTLKVEQGDNP